MFKSFTFCKYGDDGAVNNEEDGPLADLAGTHGLEMLGHHPVDYVDDHPTARARARARARAVEGDGEAEARRRRRLRVG